MDGEERLQTSLNELINGVSVEKLVADTDLVKYKQVHGIDNMVGTKTTPLDFKMEVDRLYVTGLATLGKRMDTGYHEKVKGANEGLLSAYKDCTGNLLGYYRGPVKSATRMGDKLSEYDEDIYPRTKCIIDPVRGTLCFKTAKEVLEAIENINGAFKVLRIKNKFAPEAKGFRNVMMNLIYTDGGLSIVGEVQITTEPFLKLKKIQHKFYDFTRAFGGEGDKANTPEEVFKIILAGVCGVKP